MPTYAGFLESWKRVDGNTLRLGFGQLDGTTVVVEGRTTPQCADRLESLFTERPDTWFEMEVREDGTFGRYSNNPCRAPRGEVVRGSFNSMQDFRDGYVAIGLQDAEGYGRTLVVRKDAAFGHVMGLLSSAMGTIVEMKIDGDLSVTSSRLSPD